MISLDETATKAAEASAESAVFVARYTYVPKFEDELALKPGTAVTVLKQPEGGWWFGSVDARCVSLE